MVKVTDISIPPGLEDLFFKFFQFGNNITQTSYNTKSHTKTRQKKKRLRERSLFLLWQSLYDGFDSTRKSAWTAYWITLPFGDHGGANGWPGSGFSAFVYVNAPRYKLGEDLLLDPPVFVNLIPNGDFSAGDMFWDLFNASVSSGHAVFEPVGDYSEIFNAMDSTDALTVGHTYRFTGNVGAGSGNVFVSIGNGDGPIDDLSATLPAGYGDFSYDHVATGDDTDVDCDCYTEDGFAGFISNLSFIDLG